MTIFEFELRAKTAFPRINFSQPKVDNNYRYEITSEDPHTMITWDKSNRTWNVRIGLGLVRYESSCLSIGEARAEVEATITNDIRRRQELLSKVGAFGDDCFAEIQ